MKTVFSNTSPIEVFALQNNENHFQYSDEVEYIIRSTFLDDYRLVAEKINERSAIGLACIQDEFNLFDVEYDDYILAFIFNFKQTYCNRFPYRTSKS